jgi:hypothetical protein
VSDLLGHVLVDPTVKLTVRQRYALEIIHDLQPVTSDELGAHLCARRGKHAADTRCQYDTVNGREVARALRAKGLVRERRDEGWYIAGSGPVGRTGPGGGPGYDPATAAFPEGF